MKRKTKNALISRKPQKCPEMLLKDIDDVPEGEPLFLYSSAIGFYSKGCSHVVIRDGVPQHDQDRSSSAGAYSTVSCLFLSLLVSFCRYYLRIQVSFCLMLSISLSLLLF